MNGTSAASPLRVRVRLVALLAGMYLLSAQAQTLEYAVMRSTGARAGHQVVTTADRSQSASAPI